MAKSFKINGVDYDAQAFNLTEQAAARVKGIFDEAIKEALKIYGAIGLTKGVFRFSDYPQVRDRVNKWFAKFANDLQVNIDRSTTEAWYMSQKKNDALIKEISRITGIKQTKLGYTGEMNLNALKSFQTRREGGLRLSQRIWKQARQAKNEIEQAIGGGIANGDSAAKISRDLRNNLNEPERLYRRVRDKNGNLQLSAKARNYSPGQGVYRSSYKNALRVSRTETNMAYRTADYSRWQGLPFVVGIEIRLSNNPNRCDLCVAIAGKYPKNFFWRGNHPNCRCSAVPIMLTPDEYDLLEDAQLNDKDITLNSKNEVSKVNPAAIEWFEKNKEKLANYASLPNFIADNPSVFKF